jgi:1,2-diacylglycerol 3-beta-galactosyltransferase
MAPEDDALAARLREHGPMAGHDERVVLFLFSDTGGGHRRAAEAVMAALAARPPGSYRLVMHDPLLGPSAAWPPRLLARLYGPAVRRAPWAWGAGWYVSNSRLAMAVLYRTVFAGIARDVAARSSAVDPDVIVSCHPLTGRAAVLAARGQPGPVPVVTLVTDLVRVHASWREPGADAVLVPSAAAAAACRAAGVPAARCVPAGLPVAMRTQAEPGAAVRPGPDRPAGRFVVLLAGGGEGGGSLARRAAALLRGFPDVHVVVACGRNERLRRRLTARARRAPGRLTVLGYVSNFTEWIRCADVVVTKAGPAVISEAACCGIPLLLTSHLPGQERGNAELVLQAGAGRSARGIGGMLAELAAMRADPGGLAAMRAATVSLATPDAAARAAEMIAGLAGAGGAGPPGSPARPARAAGNSSATAASAGTPGDRSGVARAGAGPAR